MNRKNRIGKRVLTLSLTAVMLTTSVSPVWAEEQTMFSSGEETDIFTSEEIETPDLVGAPVFNKYVTVLFTDHGKRVGGASIRIPKAHTTVSTDEVRTYLPEGYMFAQEGWVNIKVDTATFEVRKTQNIRVLFQDETSGATVGNAQITVSTEVFHINTDKLTQYLPTGYALVSTGDLPIYNGSVIVTVKRLKKDVIVKFLEDGKPVREDIIIQVDTDAICVNANELKQYLPEGYEFVIDGDLRIENGVIVTTVRRVQQTVIVKFLENGKPVREDVTIKVAAEAICVNANELKQYLPEGYEFVIDGDLRIENGVIATTVRRVQQTVIVKFLENGKPVREDVTIKVAAEAICVNANELKQYLPEGYEFVIDGDLRIENGVIATTVRRAKKDVIVKFWNGTKQVGKPVTIQVNVNAKRVNSKVLEKYLPSGYKFVTTGKFTIKNGIVNVAVKKSQKKVTVKFFDGKKRIGKPIVIKVDVDAKRVDSKVLAQYLPKGYEFVKTGKFAIKNGIVSVAVKKSQKTVSVKFLEEETQNLIDKVDITVAANENHVNTNKLTAYLPEGYEFVITGDLPIENGVITATVRRVQQTVSVKFLEEETQKLIGSVGITVAANEIHVNTNKLTGYLPEGYEFVITGDLPIENGVITATVRRVQQTVSVKYMEEGNLVKEVFIKVAANATHVTLAELEANLPEGYTLITDIDVRIKDGSVFAEVKGALETVTVKFLEEETQKFIGSVDITVAANENHVNTNKLTKYLPEGYDFVITGDLTIVDGVITATVRRIKDVTVRYMKEGELVAEVSIKVAANATHVTLAELEANLPEGYTLITGIDVRIKDGSVFAEVVVKSI